MFRISIRAAPGVVLFLLERARAMGNKIYKEDISSYGTDAPRGAG